MDRKNFHLWEWYKWYGKLEEFHNYPPKASSNVNMNVHVWQSGIFILLLPGKGVELGYYRVEIRYSIHVHKHLHKYSFSLCRKGDV